MSKECWNHTWEEMKKGWKEAAWAYDMMAVLAPISFVGVALKMFLTHEIPHTRKDIGLFVLISIGYALALLNGWCLREMVQRWTGLWKERKGDGSQ